MSLEGTKRLLKSILKAVLKLMSANTSVDYINGTIGRYIAEEVLQVINNAKFVVGIITRAFKAC